MTGFGSKIVKYKDVGTFTQYSVPEAFFVAAGPDGNIWFTEPGANTVGRLLLASLPEDGLPAVSEVSLTFNATTGRKPPSAQTLEVSFPAGAAFTAASTAFWLTVSPAGSLSGAQSLTIAANHTTIATSQYGISYLAWLYLTSGNVTQTVRVTLNVAPPLTVAGVRAQPETLSFVSEAGSSRRSQDLVITHSPLGYMPIVLTYEGGAWLELATFGYSPLPSGSPW